MAKQASLAVQTGAIAPAALKLPAVFQAAPEKIVGKKWPPYITFAHPKRVDEWNKLVGKFRQVNEGDMYFIGEELVKLDSVKLALIVSKQYWSVSNSAGTELLSASWEEMPGKAWKEHVETVVLIYFPDRAIAANMQFRSTKCGAAKTLSDTALLALTPQWAQESDAHKHSMIVPQVFGRYYGEVSLAPARTAKGSGHLYRPAVATPHPTSTTEWTLFKAWSEDEATQQALNQASERYMSRIADITAKIGKPLPS